MNVVNQVILLVNVVRVSGAGAGAVAVPGAAVAVLGLGGAQAMAEGATVPVEDHPDAVVHHHVCAATVGLLPLTVVVKRCLMQMGMESGNAAEAEVELQVSESDDDGCGFLRFCMFSYITTMFRMGAAGSLDFGDG